MHKCFQQEFPDIKVTVNQGSSLSIMESLLNYDNEIAVISKVQDHPEVIFEPLGRAKVVCIANPSHAFARRDDVGLDEVFKEQLIMPQEGSGTRKLLMSLCQQYDYIPNVLMDVGSSEMIKELVQSGEGISFLEEDAARPEIEQGRLVKVQIHEQDMHIDIYRAYLKNHELSAAAKAFLDISRKELKKRPSETSIAMN